MQVTIVTPVGVKFAGEAASIVAPSVSGDVGILPGHQPMLAALRTGPALVTIAGQEPLHLVIDAGYMHVISGDHVSIVTELCESWKEVDVARATSELTEATQVLQQAREEIDSATWKAKKRAVDLASTRIAVGNAKP